MLRGVKEEVVFLMTHVVAETYHYIGNPPSRVPKPLMMSERFDPIYINELIDVWLAYASFHKGDEECHYDVQRIRGKLKGSHFEVLKHCLDKTMKG